MRASVKKIQNREKRKQHIRMSISGTPEMPRVTVFRSNQHFYAQVIDDVNHKTVVAASDYDVKGKKMKGMEKATEIGKTLAKKVKSAGIDAVVFDRNGYKYHGKVKALADAMREGGLKL
ncbi:MAG: 50S ribosomal protein L18 [Candidatus Dojkabacteria bacterium]